MNRMLYIIYGIGADSVGLVGGITSPIAAVRGNIVDMRQDVLHGLFTIYLVVDLGEATVPVKEFRAIVDRISAETGVKLSIERYTPTPRGVEKKNMLVTLVGKDKSGIIATITVSYTHLRAHETVLDLVCRLLLEKKNKHPHNNTRYQHVIKN